MKRVLCILLVAACGSHGNGNHGDDDGMGPDGGGGGNTCPETTTATGNDHDISDDETDNDVVTAPVRHTQKTKPVVTPRSSNGGGNHSTAPRWHSFLPGMFR